VSYVDFEDTLGQLQVQASKHEIASIIRLLDKDNKGFLDFRSFSQAVNPHMSEMVGVKKNELHLPNLVPNKEKLHEYGNKQNQLTQAVNEVRRTFNPDQETSKALSLIPLQSWLLPLDLAPSLSPLIPSSTSSQTQRPLGSQVRRKGSSRQEISMRLLTSRGRTKQRSRPCKTHG